MASKYDEARKAWGSSKYASARAAWSGSPSAESASTAETPAEGPGMLGSFVRGAYRSPANVLGLAQTMRGRANQPETYRPGMSLEDIRSQPTQAQVMDALQTQRSGIAAPTNFRERLAENAGLSLPLTAASMAGPVVGAGNAALNATTASGMAAAKAFGTGAALSLKNNVIQTIASDTASQFAREKGYGPGVQIVSGMLAAMVVPTSIRNPFGGRSGAPEAEAPTLAPLSDEQVVKLAKQYKVKPDNMRAAAKILQDRIIIDPVTGQPKTEEFVKALDEVMALFPEGKARPTLAQAAGDLGGSNLLAMETDKANVDAIYSSRLGGNRHAVVEDLNDRYQQLVPNGSTESALDQSSALRDHLTAVKDGKWSQVTLDEMPFRPIGGIREAYEALRKRPIYFSKIPSEVRGIIESADDSISAQNLQDIRAYLGNVIEAGDRFDASPEARAAKVSAGKLMEPITAELKQLPEDGSQAYRDAMAATKDYYDVFDPKSKAVQAFAKLTDRKQIVAKIQKSSNPIEALEDAQRMFSRTETGLDDLRHMILVDLVGEKIGDIPIGKVRDRLTMEGSAKFYKKALGAEDFDTLREIVRGYEVGTRFPNGTPAAALKTQSSSLVRQFAAAVASPIQSAKKLPGWMADRISSDASNAAQQEEIISQLAFDLPLSRKLALVPRAQDGVKAQREWLQNWSVLVARAKARSSLSALKAAGVDVSGRAVDRLPALGRSIASGIAPQPGPFVFPQPQPGPVPTPGQPMSVDVPYPFSEGGVR